MLYRDSGNRESREPFLFPPPLGPLLVLLAGCLSASLAAQTPRILAVDEGANSLQILHTDTFMTVATLPLGINPGFPAEVPSMRRLYVPNRDSNSVTVVDLQTESVLTTITDASLLQPVAATSNPSGSEVWVVNKTGGSGSGSISIINPATNTVTAVVTAPSLSNPVHAATHPVSGLVFVVNSATNRVSVFSPTPLRSVRAVVNVGIEPSQVTILPGSNYAFVANHGSGDVSRINFNTFEVLTDFVGGSPRALVPLLGSIFVTREDRSLAILSPASGAVQLINLPVGVATYGLGSLAGTAFLLVGDRNNGQIRVVDAATQTELAAGGLPISGFTTLGAIRSTGLIAKSDLSIVKTDGVDPIRAGAVQTYTLQVTNSGPSIAHNVVIEDTLPPNVEMVSAQLPGANCQLAAPGIRCELPSLSVAAQVNASIQLRFSQAGDYLNQAEVSADEEDTNPDNNQDDEMTSVLPSSDLELEMEVDPPAGSVGATLVFNAVVRNRGPSTSATITFLLAKPMALTLIDSKVSVANCQSGAISIRCNIGALLRDAEFNLQFTFAALAAGSFLPVASISAPGFDPNDANNSKFVPLVISPAEFVTDLSITKTARTPAVQVGELARFSISLLNQGPETDQGVQWSDTIPPGFTYVNLTPSSVGCTLTGPTFSCPVGQLPSGQGRTYTIFLRAQEGASGLIRNTVTVSGFGQDSNPENNTASDVVLILGSGDFNADGKVDAADVQELILEINDGDGEEVGNVAGGSHAGVPTMDLNHDGLVNQADLEVLAKLILQQ